MATIDLSLLIDDKEIFKTNVASAITVDTFEDVTKVLNIPSSAFSKDDKSWLNSAFLGFIEDIIFVDDYNTDDYQNVMRSASKMLSNKSRKWVDENPESNLSLKECRLKLELICFGTVDGETAVEISSLSTPSEILSGHF